jgi:hypothetical protein
MLGIVFANILDTEVVDNETENDRSCDVLEESRGVVALVIAVSGEEWNECVVCKTAGLWEAIHAAANFHIDIAIMDEWGQVVVHYANSSLKYLSE